MKRAGRMGYAQHYPHRIARSGTDFWIAKAPKHGIAWQCGQGERANLGLLSCRRCMALRVLLGDACELAALDFRSRVSRGSEPPGRSVQHALPTQHCKDVHSFRVGSVSVLVRAGADWAWKVKDSTDGLEACMKAVGRLVRPLARGAGINQSTDFIA